MKNKPHALTKNEWLELANVQEVRDAFGIHEPADHGAFRDSVFAARFDYVSDGPGYAGDLFIILGGEPECPSIKLIRQEDRLKIVDCSDY